MKEKIIKFIIIALVALFSAKMACADTVQQVRYPYVERVEIGYSPQAFSTDSVTRAKNTKVIRHAKQEEKEITILDVAVILVGVIILGLMGIGGIQFIILMLGIIAMLLTRIFHKKR